MRQAAILLLFLALYSVQALPQQVLQQAPMAGAIEGTIIHNITGEPVAGAQVTLTAINANLLPTATMPPPRPQTFPPVVTGADGKFTFKNINAGTAQISGTVTDLRAQPVPGIQVALIPAQRYRTDLYRPALTNQNGNFSYTNVVPGEYKLFSWEALVNAVFDPDFLKQYEQQGKIVHIAESSKQDVDVKLIPAP